MDTVVFALAHQPMGPPRPLPLGRSGPVPPRQGSCPYPDPSVTPTAPSCPQGLFRLAAEHRC